MMRKEEIIVWFTQQPSHHRLDVLCTLAHLCLPFELRFINTCVDYLARRVSPSAKDAESLATLEKTYCPQPGESLDLQDEAARRKLIWSLYLLQASNRVVAHTIYRILRDTYSDPRQLSSDAVCSGGGNGVRDSAVQELHLIFTMAIHHPSFTFEERFKLGEIYRSLQATKILSKSRTPSPPVITPTPTPSPPEAAGITVTAPPTSQAQIVSISTSSSGHWSPSNGRSSRTSTVVQNSTSSLSRRQNTVRGHNKSNHNNGSASGENSSNLSAITLLLKEQLIGKDPNQQNYNSFPRLWKRFEKLTAAELAEHSDQDFQASGLSNTFISHLRKLINQQLQISNNHHNIDTDSNAGSTRSGGIMSSSRNGINEEPFSHQLSIQQSHQVGSNNKLSLGPHRSNLVKTCMGPPNVQPAFHNTQQRNQQQAMQAAVEAQQQQLHQAAQHHHHQQQIHLHMQQQAYQQMQHHLAQKQHQQEPPLSRAGSSSSASSSGSSSLETCSPPSSPTDSNTVVHRNGDADCKTYAAPQSVAPPTAVARPQARGPSASPATLRGPSANTGFLRPIRNNSNDVIGNLHRHPAPSTTVAAAPAPSSSISPAPSSSISSSSSSSSTTTSTHKAASQPRDMPFSLSLSYAVQAQHQPPVSVMTPGTVSAQPNPVPVVAAPVVVPAQQPTASFIVNSSTPPPHIEAQPVQPTVYSYHGYLPMNGDGSSAYSQPPFTFITSGPPPGSTRGVPPGPHHEMFIYSPNSFQGQIVTQPLSTHHGSSISGRMMELPYLQPILVTTAGPSSRSDGMGTDYSRPPPPGTSSQPDCRIGGVPSPLPGNLSCFNCGASGHLGTQCQQISVEDIIRPSPAC